MSFLKSKLKTTLDFTLTTLFEDICEFQNLGTYVSWKLMKKRNFPALQMSKTNQILLIM